MPTRIRGSTNTGGSVVIIDELDWSVERMEDLEFGDYGVLNLNSNKKTIAAVRPDGEVVGYGYVSPIDYLTNYFGTGIDRDVTISTNTELTVSNKVGDCDGDMVVMNYNNLTINAGITLTTEQPCRGLLIYVRDTCTLNGTISMTARGPCADPTAPGSDGNMVQTEGLLLNFIAYSGTGTYTSAESDFNGFGLAAVEQAINRPSVLGNGVQIRVPRTGGAGAPSYFVPLGTTVTGLPGGSGGYAEVDSLDANKTIVSTAGGGSGGANAVLAETYAPGGGHGSVFGGGAGGGGAQGIDDLDSYPDLSPGEWGGPGGVGTTTSGIAAEMGGGAGNPYGGTGGLLIVITNKLVMGADAKLEADGTQGFSATGSSGIAAGGGGSGGGAVIIKYGSLTVDGGGNIPKSGSITNTGGSGGDVILTNDPPGTDPPEDPGIPPVVSGGTGGPGGTAGFVGTIPYDVVEGGSGAPPTDVGGLGGPGGSLPGAAGAGGYGAGGGVGGYEDIHPLGGGSACWLNCVWPRPEISYETLNPSVGVPQTLEIENVYGGVDPGCYFKWESNGQRLVTEKEDQTSLTYTPSGIPDNYGCRENITLEVCGEVVDAITMEMCGGSSIGYTASLMNIGSNQTLSVQNPKDGCEYAWSNNGGTVNLSAETGTSITATAPGSQTGCDTAQTIITLSVCGQTIDTLTLTVNNNSPLGNYYTPAYFINTITTTHLCTHGIAGSNHLCDGNVNGASGCDGCDCVGGGGAAECCCSLDNPCTGFTCYVQNVIDRCTGASNFCSDAVGTCAAGTYDRRTEAVIDAGCCPEALYQ